MSRGQLCQKLQQKTLTKDGGTESPFSADELKKWHEILIAKRQEITEEINGLIRDAMDVEDGWDMTIYRTHNVDRGSDADMQDISLGMVGNEEE